MQTDKPFILDFFQVNLPTKVDWSLTGHGPENYHARNPSADLCWVLGTVDRAAADPHSRHNHRTA
jgi:hypothetical protein